MLNPPPPVTNLVLPAKNRVNPRLSGPPGRPRSGKGLISTHRLSRKQREIERRSKRHSISCKDSDRSYFSYFFAQVNFKVTRGRFRFFGESRFSRIAFELIKIENRRRHHRVSLAETVRNIYFLISKSQGQNLTSGQGHEVTN